MEEVPGGEDDEELGFGTLCEDLLLSKPLDDGQGKRKGLTWARAISGNEI
jgi:hypothetical protein